jgi:hypothetical protein
VFIDIMTAKYTLQPTGGYMAAAHSGSSVSRFRLIGVIHAFFNWEDTEPDFAGDSKGVGVNMGIAIVIPAEEVIECLS